jgi:hypothetical protein
MATVVALGVAGRWCGSTGETRLCCYDELAVLAVFLLHLGLKPPRFETGNNKPASFNINHLPKKQFIDKSLVWDSKLGIGIEETKASISISASMIQSGSGIKKYRIASA